MEEMTLTESETTVKDSFVPDITLVKATSQASNASSLSIEFSNKKITRKEPLPIKIKCLRLVSMKKYRTSLDHCRTSHTA